MVSSVSVYSHHLSNHKKSHSRLRVSTPLLRVTCPNAAQAPGRGTCTSRATACAHASTLDPGRSASSLSPKRESGSRLAGGASPKWRKAGGPWRTKAQPGQTGWARTLLTCGCSRKRAPDRKGFRRRHGGRYHSLSFRTVVARLSCRVKPRQKKAPGAEGCVPYYSVAHGRAQRPSLDTPTKQEGVPQQHGIEGPRLPTKYASLHFGFLSFHTSSAVGNGWQATKPSNG